MLSEKEVVNGKIEMDCNRDFLANAPETFQEEDYKGTVRYKVGGNTKGFSLLEGAEDYIADTDFSSNPCKFQMLDDEWYSVVLKNEKGEELFIEDEVRFLAEKIVRVEIVGFEEEKG